MNVATALVGLSTNNCNGRLSALYEERDRIGRLIDHQFDLPLGFEIIQAKIDELDEQYDKVCEVISQLCVFRRVHNCSIQGDPEYMSW